MTQESDVQDVIETVVKRAAFLDRLAAGPTAKRDLRDDLDVSRSTVYKAIRELEDAGIAEQTEEGCRLTLFGRLVVEQYWTFAEAVDDIEPHASLLGVLPPDCPMITGVLVGAEIILTEQHAPYRPVGRIEDVVRNADSVTAMTPVVVPQYVDLFREQIVERDTTAELVLESPVVEYLRSDHGERFAETLETGRLAVWETSETIPFGIVASLDEIAVLVYTENGELAGILVNDTDAALDWGREMFGRFRARTDRLVSP